MRRATVMTLLVLGLAIPAFGQGPGRDGRAGGPVPLKDRRCVAQCRRETRACLKDARAAAAPCFEACKSLVDAARAACETDPQSDACQAAAEAARACLAPCYDAYRPVVRECKHKGRECVRACPFIGEPPCLARCRPGYVHCLAGARRTLTE